MKGKIFAARPDEHAHESTQWWDELFSKKKDRLPEDAVEDRISGVEASFKATLNIF